MLPAVAAAALGPAAIGPQARMYALVWGLVLSRFGLWSFDLAANQLIQESADPAALGTINGVQGALHLAGVALPATEDFLWLMAGSCCMVALAAALFTAFALRTRCGRRLAAPALQVVQTPDARA